MGDVPAGHISKGVIHAKVDALVNSRDLKGAFDKRAGFLAALKLATTSDQYIQILKDQAQVTDKEADYLNDYFYKVGERWWESLQPVFPILHQSLIKALDEAGDTLLLDSYWLPAADAQTVEVIICKSETQVTRIFHTPPPGDGPQSMRTKPAPIWILKAKADPSVQKGVRTTDAVVERIDGTVATWRMQEL